MTGIASKGQLRMSFLRYALVTVPAVLLLGTLSGALAGSGYDNPWFAALNKPAAVPPGWVFATVWPVLYVMLGLSLAMILHARGAKGRERAVILFGLQLLLNFAWSPVFFALHKIDTSVSIIAAMIVVAVAQIFLMWRIRIGAALLIFPYLGWLMFAATLTFQISAMNPEAETLVPGGSSADIAL